MSVLQLHADAARNALDDAQLKPRNIDGIATTEINPMELGFYLGIQPDWVDGTSIGGCVSMTQVRHAAAAILQGLCTTVLIVQGESGYSRIGGADRKVNPASLGGQFVMPYGAAGAVNTFTLPALRYMHEFGVTEEELAYVAVVQREWASRNPRAAQREAITIEKVLASRMIAYPFRKLMCCLVTDGGGALILTSAARVPEFPARPVYVLGAGEAYESFDLGIAHAGDPLRPDLVRRSGAAAFAGAGLTVADVDHAMIYDAFVHTPLWGLEGLGFVDYGEAARFVFDGHTRAGGSLPMNTNGGGLSYTHSGHYGMYAIQESVRQLRGTAAAQIDDIEVSLVHGYGNQLSACATLILGNQIP